MGAEPKLEDKVHCGLPAAVWAQRDRQTETNANVKGAAVRKSAVFYQAIDLTQESHPLERRDERSAFVTSI